jgi:hypothetical protein
MAISPSFTERKSKPENHERHEIQPRMNTDGERDKGFNRRKQRAEGKASNLKLQTSKKHQNSSFHRIQSFMNERNRRYVEGFCGLRRSKEEMLGGRSLPENDKI